MKRALLFVMLLACHPKTNAIADAGTSLDSSIGEDEEEEALLAQPEGGTCPRRLHPNYCRNGCRPFASRKGSKHARRVRYPERLAFGTCDTFDVFAEDEQPGDGGVTEGITEYFDDAGALVGAVDTRLQGCTEFGHVPTCTPRLTWEVSSEFTMTVGFVDAPHGLSPEVITRIVRQNVGRFELCARNAKETRPPGRYGAKLHIAKGGEVSGVEDDGMTLKSHALSECIAKGLSALSFPEPKGGDMIARITLTFGR